MWGARADIVFRVERDENGSLDASGSATAIYPAIKACICEERLPTRGEIRAVASRLWREGLAQRFGSKSTQASFTARRVLLRAAIAALSGTSTSGNQERLARIRP